MFRKFAAALVFAAMLIAPAAADDVMDRQIVSLARAWDHANFEISGHDAQLEELRRLEAQAERLAAQYPAAAEPLVWQAIILSTEAGVQGGLGALGKVTQARDLLVRAEQINANALGDGSVYTSLGSLYYQVPGFPVGFGNRTRARQYLERALQMNPTGIDANYFMADYLIRGNDYAHATEYLRRVQAAPARAGREVADAGRRREAAVLMARAEGHR